MPPDHREYLQWIGGRFTQWAEQTGENTAKIVHLFLTAGKVEQQGYKSCMTLLRLADKYSVPRLEAACKKVLSFTSSPSLKSIQSILRSGLDRKQEEGSPAHCNVSQYSFTRGAEYYRRDR